MIDPKVGRNFAAALFETTPSAKRETTLEQFINFCNIVNDQAIIKHNLCSPALSYSHKKRVLENIHDKLKFEQPLYIILDNMIYLKDMKHLEQILKSYKKLLDKADYIKQVKVISKEMLKEDEINFIKEHISKDKKYKLNITNIEDSKIIAGCIIEYDDILIDYSLAGAIKKIDTELRRGLQN